MDRATMSGRRTRKPAVIGLALALALGLTATSGAVPVVAQDDAELSGKIVFLERWPEPQFAPFWEKVVADYLALHPEVEIDHQAIADQPFKDKIRVLTASGELPDIYFSWAGDFAKKFVRAGLAADLTSEVRGTDWGDHLAGAAVEAWTYDDKIYGIPISVDGKFFLYNTELFDEYAVEVPQSIDELLDACDTFSAAGLTPITFGNKDGWAAIHYLTGLNAKYVPRETLLADYEVTSGEFTDPGYLQALQTLAALNERCLTPGANGVDYSVAQAEFMAGLAAMYYGQSVEFKTFTEDGSAPEGFDDLWNFFPMPPVEGGAGTQDSLVGAPDGFIVNAQSENLPVAIDFMKFLTNSENGEMFATMQGRLSSVTGSATEENAIPQLIQALAEIDAASAYDIWLDTIVHAEVAGAYLAGAQGLLEGSKTPEQVMEDVQAAAQRAKESL